MLMNHARGTALMIAALGWLAGTELHGQANGTDGRGAHWLSSAHYLHYRLEEQGDWRGITLLTGRVTDARTTLLVLEAADREGFRDYTAGVDLYQAISSGGYIAFRGRVAPGAEIVPRLLADVDLFHTLGGGWEAWVGYEHRRYPLQQVHSFGLGPAVYVGPWYLRAQPSAARAEGETTVVGTLTARRLVGDSPVNYGELGGGYGEEFVEMVPTETGRVVVDAQTTWFLSARGQAYLTSRFGLTVGAVYQTYRGLGARPSVSIGVLGRL